MNTDKHFNACEQHATIRYGLEPDQSFLSYFKNKKNYPLFEKFAPVLWNEYSVLRNTFYAEQWLPLYYRHPKNGWTCLDSDELKQVLDCITLRSLLVLEKDNSVVITFATEKLTGINPENADHATEYFKAILKQDNRKRNYFDQLVETLRGNKGISQDISHKKWNIKPGDILPTERGLYYGGDDSKK